MTVEEEFVFCFVLNLHV